MTDDHTAQEPRVSHDGDLARRLAGQREVIGRTVLSSVRGTAGIDDGLTEELVDAVVGSMARRLALAGVVPGAFRSLGGRCARNAVPLAVALGVVQLTGVTTSHRWWAVAGPGDVEPLFALGREWDAAVAEIVAEVSDGYAHELELASRTATARQQVAVEMISGRPVPAGLLRAADLRPRSHYALLCCQPSHPAAHRHDTVTDLLERPLGSTEVLTLDRGGQLMIMVPAPDIAPTDRAQAARDLFAVVDDVLGIDVAGVALTPTADVPAAAARSLTVLDLALSRGVTGVVLVSGAESLLARPLRTVAVTPPPPAGHLGEWPLLESTLRELYRQGMDHGRTALHLGIGRRILTRRLQRVIELTGADPLSRSGRRRFLAELTVRDEPAVRDIAPRTA